MMEPTSPITVRFADVVAAAGRLAGKAHRTPVLTNRSINERASRDVTPREIFFKCENLQRVGAFKFRGAFNAISLIPADDLRHGVVTHSSGNHAQAVAAAAALHGAAAWIVMPRTALPVKRQAVAGYGATIIDCEPTLADREKTARRIQDETGATLVHPFDDPYVIAGQGTAALEFVEQVRGLDLIIAPIGGGGLVSGTALVARHHNIDVIGAEPAGADDAARSKAAGQLIEQTSPQTIADGLLTSLGGHTWPIIRDLVREIITVEDSVTIELMRFFIERTKHVIEPSSAVAVATALSDQVLFNNRWRRIGVILSGGNANIASLPWSDS